MVIDDCLHLVHPVDLIHIEILLPFVLFEWHFGIRTLRCLLVVHTACRLPRRGAQAPDRVYADDGRPAAARAARRAAGAHDVRRAQLGAVRREAYEWLNAQGLWELLLRESCFYFFEGSVPDAGAC